MKTDTLELKTSTAYFRDSFVPFTEANLSIASSPVLYGLSVYTVLSVAYNPKKDQLYVFRLRDHYERLVNSAKIMDFNGFAENWSYNKFEKTIQELLVRNQVKQDALVRVLFFIDDILSGTQMHGLPTSLVMFTYASNPLYKTEAINVCISSWKRTPDNSIPSRAKANGSYINSSLMKNEALINGFDDAIALDEHGHVSESTVANLFIVRGTKLITPHAATDILEGITRDTVQKMAEKLGIEHRERSVDRSELFAADEAFLCGSTARITPILSVDRHAIGDRKVGTITKQIAQEYARVQHGDTNDFSEWRQSVTFKK